MENEIFWCKNCLNTSTRPRINFNKLGNCNACVWSEEKKSLNWNKRQEELLDLIDQNKSKTSGYDCIVPVSGGKDGSYVSYQLKEKYNLNPLTITVRPALEMQLGNENLDLFINSGYDHIHITPNARVMNFLNKYGFIEKGFPYYGWLIAIHTAVLRIAANFNINLIFYGEDGEVEYGGSVETKLKPTYDTNYQRKVYLEDGYYNLLDKIKATPSELYFYKFPSEDECSKIKITHWSYFESWDPYRNYLIAKEKCGLKERKDTNSGTFTNFAQNDQALYDLHTYMMYLKFGFGRATQDAGIEIRRGAMTRDQGINLVNLYDGQYPENHLPLYLKYFSMKLEEFELTLDKWANNKLFYKDNENKWKPKFKIK
tara:strand:- start:188 stop:1300 length:1113 start_codon:yes stop_codon:yes gene_type:complete